MFAPAPVSPSEFTRAEALVRENGSCNGPEIDNHLASLILRSSRRGIGIEAELRPSHSDNDAGGVRISRCELLTARHLLNHEVPDLS